MDNEKAILAKKEVTYGTDAAPTASANAVLTRNFKATPVAGDTLQRNLDVPSRGAPPAALTARRMLTEFEVEISGSGTAGVAPAWMELNEACAMEAATLVAATSATQKFLAAGLPISSLTEHHWISNQRRRSVGNRGTWNLDFSAGAYPFFKYNWMGLLAAVPVDQNVPTASTLTRWKPPIEVNKDNTTFLLDGYAAPLKQLTINAQADVKLRNLVGQRYVQKGNHALQFTAVCEAVDVATKNYFNSMGGLVSMQLVHGTVAGNIVQLDTANLQILAIEESEEDDVLMHTISGTLAVVAGQDDLLITAK